MGMILGIGTDLMDMERLSKESLSREDPFAVRTFSEAELDAADKTQDPYSYLAVRFAGKEAVFKAFRRSIPHARFSEIEILNDQNGAPCVNLYGYTKKAALQLGITQIHISLTYEKEYAAAFAVLEGARYRP